MGRKPKRKHDEANGGSVEYVARQIDPIMASLMDYLDDELKRAEAKASVKIDEEATHTCSDYCQRPACVRRRLAAAPDRRCDECGQYMTIAGRVCESCQREIEAERERDR